MSADTARIIRACELIREDMESDVKRMEGKLVNGTMLGEMHGNLSAAISALAGMVAKLAGGVS